MSLSKRILKDPHVITALSYVLAGYIRLAYHTSRRKFHIDDEAAPYLMGQKNAVYAFWHGRMMMVPMSYLHVRKMHVLISLHRDGELISKVVGHLGFGTVSGSSSRGGEAAARQIVRLLEEGCDIGITPDGPRGPNQKVVGGGVVSIAQMAGVPVIPVAYSASRCFRLSSWDKFMLVRPFGKLVFYIGKPIHIGEGDEQMWRSRVEQEMNALVEKADGNFA